MMGNGRFIWELWHGETVVGTVTSHQLASWFKAVLGPFCVEFVCVCVFSFPQSKAINLDYLVILK